MVLKRRELIKVGLGAGALTQNEVGMTCAAAR